MGHAARILSAVCVFVCACAARPASGAILTPSDVLRVTFTVVPAVPTPDVMTLNLGVVQVLAAHTSRTGAMYDGNTLLGVGSTNSFGNHVGALSLSPARGWVSPTSVWNFDNPAVADFTPIQNGTLNGRIDVTIATGSMDINLANVSLGMGQGSSPNIFINSNPPPVITSVAIVPIPEPSSAAACGVVATLLARRRSR